MDMIKLEINYIKFLFQIMWQALEFQILTWIFLTT